MRRTSCAIYSPHMARPGVRVRLRVRLRVRVRVRVNLLTTHGAP